MLSANTPSHHTTFIPLLAESKEHHARKLFDSLYKRAQAEPFNSPRRKLLDDASGRAVRILEIRERRAKRIRYGMVANGAYKVVSWIPNYDGRDAITGHSKYIIASFSSFVDAENFIAGEYDEREASEARLEIEGPFCPVRFPLISHYINSDELPF